MMGLADRLPDFPWDTIADVKARAAAHPEGLIDLTVGTPVDPTPQIAREALTGAADAHGYPTTVGTPELREAIIGYLEQRWGVPDLEDKNVLPVVGTKELVAWLPLLLGLGGDDVVVYPACAYPTYAVGAQVAGAGLLATDDPAAVPDNAKLIWINSPGNPSGKMLSREELRAWVAAARRVGAVLASDECYGEFAWDAEPISVLDPQITDGDRKNIVALHSISKRSNAAGYRGGFIAGCGSVVGQLLAARKHLGMMVPTPIQAAMVALLEDQAHVDEQREIYAHRRAELRQAVEAAGFRVDDSEGSLYLWVSRDEDCRATVDWFADRGILVTPGHFYGEAGNRHVRVAFTATDEAVEAAVARLAAG